MKLFSQKGFAPVLIIIILALGGIGGYLFLGNKAQNLNTHVDTSDPKQILIALQKQLSVTSPITELKNVNWKQNDQVIPLTGQMFYINGDDAFDKKYGNYFTSNVATEDFFKPLQTDTDNFFSSLSFQKDSENTSLNTEIGTRNTNLEIGYTKGDSKCLGSFVIGSSGSHFFCGTLDQQQYQWRKELALGDYFTVNKVVGNYANGSAPDHSWIATRENGVWRIIIKGQENPTCGEVDKYKVPQEIYVNCYSDSGKLRFPTSQ